MNGGCYSSSVVKTRCKSYQAQMVLFLIGKGGMTFMYKRKIASRQRKGSLFRLRQITQNPFALITSIVGSGFMGICFYFIGIYFLTVYLTGEQWNLRAIIFSPLPIDRLHAIGIGFVLTLITLGIAYLMIWQTLQAITISKKHFLQTLMKNSFLVGVMSCIVALFTSGSASALTMNIFLYPVLGFTLAAVVASIIHMHKNLWITFISLIGWGFIAGAVLLFFQDTDAEIISIVKLIVAAPFLVPIIIYWALLLALERLSSIQIVYLQDRVVKETKMLRYYQQKEKGIIFSAIILGIFVTIAGSAHIVYTAGGDQWFGDPYQTIYVERAMHEETPADTAMSGEEGQQLYRDQGVYIGQQGNLVTYINQNGDIIRRNDVVMIEEQPSNTRDRQIGDSRRSLSY